MAGNLNPPQNGHMINGASPLHEQSRQVTGRLQGLLEHLEAVEVGSSGLEQLGSELAVRVLEEHQSQAALAGLSRHADHVLQGRVLDVVMSSPRVMTAGATEVAGDEIAARAVQAGREVCSGIREVARAVHSPDAQGELRALGFPGPRDLSPAAFMALGLRVELRQDAGVGARQVLEELDLAVEDHRLAIGEENAAPFDRQLWQAAHEIREVSYQVHVPLMDEPRLEGELLAREHHSLADLIRRAQGIALGPRAPGEIEGLRADIDRLTIEVVNEPATAIEDAGTRFRVPAPTGLPREVWGHELTQALGADASPGAGMARHVADGLFVPGAHWDTEHVIVAKAPDDWAERWPAAGIKSGDVVVGRYTAGSCEGITVHRANHRFLPDAEPLEWSDPEPEALLRGFGVEAPVATRTQAQRFGLERIAPAVAKAISTDHALTPFEMRYGIQPAEPGIEITGP